MTKALQKPSRPDDARGRRYTLAGQIIDAARLTSGLHIVATPIGNLGDITLRALEALAGADVIACEDTRVTRKLLDRYAIATSLTPYHEHNAAQARPLLLRRLADGAAIALVSDAGTPLVSDPGFKLVRAATEAGYAVIRPARRFGRIGGARRRGLADRSVFFRRLSAAEGSRAARPDRRVEPHSGDAGVVRNRAARGGDAVRPCRGPRPNPRGGAVPGIDQIARGSPARRACGAGCGLCGSRAAWRNRVGHCATASTGADQHGRYRDTCCATRFAAYR